MSEPRPRPLRTILLATCLLLSVACQPEAPRLRETIHVFGSEATIEIVGREPQHAASVMAEVAELLNRMHRDWHPWEPGALSTLNAALARGESVPLAETLREPIMRSRPIAMRSDGLFNPAIGRLMQLWGFQTSDYPVSSPPPTEAQLAAWRQRVPSLFDLQFDGDRVSSRNPALQLDFGAIAEGMAAERIAALLRGAGIENALLAIGGDIYALGRPGERPWQVGIRDPFGAADATFAGVALHDGEALFTTGNYTRFRQAPSGARWPHVVDPRSGLPVRGVAAVSVLHDDPVLADAASTALMVAGPARFAELANRLGIRCALLLTDENELLVTLAMSERLRLQRQPVPLGPPLGAPGRCSERAP
jgi:FAD:protein FMN transferase